MQRHDTHATFFGHTPLHSRTPLPKDAPLSLRNPSQTPIAVRLRPSPDHPREALYPQRPSTHTPRHRRSRFRWFNT